VLGYGSNYAEVVGRADKILEDWSTRVTQARENLDRLQERLEETNNVSGQGADVKKTLGERMKILR
jgi:hypothetical protein